jgi:hypothetical protein
MWKRWSLLDEVIGKQLEISPLRVYGGVVVKRTIFEMERQSRGDAAAMDLLR